MSAENSAAEELARRIRALWDPPPAPTRGRPARVSRAEIVEVALAIADADGLQAVSMRPIARELGVGAMTLYSHVGSHSELVDAVVDRAYADFAIPQPDLPWRAGLEQYAREMWRLLHAHPWLLDINTWRLPLGPHVFDVEEAGYRTLVDTGLSATQVVETIATVGSVVAGHARSAVVERAEAERDGIDFETHWGMTTEFWERYFDPNRYPTMTRLWTARAFDDGASPLEVPLTGLFDTIEVLIERAQAGEHTPIPAFDECVAEE